jgi:hypothetical protein
MSFWATLYATGSFLTRYQRPTTFVGDELASRAFR